MSRSSVIYGTFSIVWGFGAVILTVVLQRLAGKEDRYIFLAGSVLGGVYEYLCSVFTEIFLGTTFWDYSDMPFVIRRSADGSKSCRPLEQKLRPGQLSC